jgi:hypothetical protein
VRERGREKSRESIAEIGVIRKGGGGGKGLRVAGVDTPPRFIVGRGPGLWRKMSTRPQTPKCTRLEYLQIQAVPQNFLGMNQ